jgi:hypothetical protein
MLKDIKVVLHTSPLLIPEGGQVHLIFEHGIGPRHYARHRCANPFVSFEECSDICPI